MPPTRDELLEYAAQARALSAQQAALNTITRPDPSLARADSRLRSQSGFPLPILDATTRDMAQVQLRRNEVDAAVQQAPAIAPVLADNRTYPLIADDIGPMSNVMRTLHTLVASNAPPSIPEMAVGAMEGAGIGSAGAPSQGQVTTARLLRQNPGYARYRGLIQRAYEGYYNPRNPIRVAGNVLGGAAAAANDAATGLLQAGHDMLMSFEDRGQRDAITAELRRQGRIGPNEDSDPVRRYLGHVRQANQGSLQTNRPDTGSQYLDSALQGLQGVPLQLTALVMAARGDPRMALGLMASFTGGSAYGDAREAGLSPLQSLSYGAVQGGLEALGETLPIFGFAHDAAQQSGLLRTLGRQFITENLGEQFTQHSQDFVQWAALDSNRGKTFGDYLAERPQVALQTLIATTAAVGVQTPIARAIVQATLQAGEAAQAQTGSAQVDQLMRAAADSRLRRESPEDFRRLIEQQLQDAPNDNLYIPAEQVRALFQSPQDMEEDPFWGGYAEQISQAEALNGDIVVPLAAAATHLAGNPQWEALKDHVRTSGGGMSRTEAREAEASFLSTFAEQAPELAKEMEANDTATAPRQQVFDAMRTKLEGAGYTADTASQMATMFAERAATRAARLGRELTGSEADAVDVRSGDAVEIDGRSLNQSSPEFQRWFGESKVRDGGGEPLVVYHGTDESFEAFDKSKVGSNFGLDSAGFFFSDDADTANRSRKSYPKKSRFSFTEEDKAAAKAGQVIEAYVRIERPLYPKDVPGWQNSMGSSAVNLYDLNREAVAEALRSGKYDGFILKAEGRRLVVPLEPTQIKSVNNHGSFDPTDPRILNQEARGRVTFTADGKATIDLFKSRDLSTFIHESGHLYLEELKLDAELASQLDTPEGQQLAADFETVKAWFAKEGHAVGDDGTIPTEAHELWARGFERYAMEGKAPSTGLRRAFEAFRSWLITIYKNVTSLRSPITPEIRDVMDRLMATDEEIAAAKEEQNIKLGFTSAAEAGMTDAEYEAYKTAATEATDSAHSALLKKVMASVRAQRTQEYREQEKGLRAEITQSADEQPVFRALAMLRSKKTPAKLDKQFLIDSYGGLDQFPQGVPPIYGETNTVHPDIIAEEAGFSSGDEMIRTLIGHELARKEAKANGDKRSPRQIAIDEGTAAAMAERYGDPLRDGSIEEEARALLYNDRQGEVFATELRALARQTGRRPTAYSIARKWAGERVAASRVVDSASGAAIQRYQKAARKSGRAFEEALAKGDKDEAFKHKQAQMLNNALVAAAKEAKDRVDVAVRRLGKLARAKTRASMDQDYLDQIHGLLEQVELRTRSQASLDEQQSYEAWALEQRQAGIDLVQEPSFAASIGKTHWSRLSVEQLLGLDETVQQIAHLGRLKQTLLDGAERRKFEDARDELIASADGSGKGRKITANNDPKRSLPERFKSRIRAADAFLIKVETLVDWLDGGKSNGPWNRLLFKPVADAQGSEGDLMRTYVAKVNALVKAMPRKQARDWDRFVDTPELIDRVSSDPALHGRAFRFGKDQVVMMALNWGNEGNKQRLLDGYGWSEAQVQAVFDRLMTAEDWTFVQEVWDALEELKAPLFEMERRVNGVEPDTVQAVPFDTPHGQMKGGYFPAVYDPNYQTKKDLQDAEQRIAGGGFFKATTRSSATKERAAQVKRPDLLSMSVITNHMREVIHDITHREAVIQVGKILADGQIRAAIDRKLGPEYVKAMDGWLDDVAKPGASESVLGPAMTRIGRWLHRGISVAGLGYRVSTTLVQPLGLSNAMGVVGERAVSEGMAIFAAHPIRTYREVTERSAEMRDRFSTMDASIADMYRDQGKAGLRRIGPNKFVRHAFDGILYADLLITTGTWIGSFNKALRDGMTEEEATYFADKVVRTSQGAGGAKDRSWALRMPHIVRTLYPFFSYLNALYNQQRDIGRKVRNADSPGKAAEVARRTWWIAIVPALAQALLFGQGPDEDDEESWAAYLARSTAIGNISSIPGIGPLATAVGNGWNYRSSSVQQVGEGVVQSIRDTAASIDGDPDTEPRGNWIKNLMSTIGVVTGTPLSAPGASAQYVADYFSGEADPQNLGDWYEGLTTGRVREDQ